MTINEKHSIDEHEVSSLGASDNGVLDDKAAVHDAMASMPWTSWATIATCAVWYASISCFQITTLFWSAPIVATVGGAPLKIWLGQSFQVITAVLGPLMAGLGDTCGRKSFVLFGLACGMVGAIVMATANSMEVVIAGTCLFGPAYGSCGNVFSIPSETVPRRHRGTAQTLIFLGAISGVLLGLFVPANFIITSIGGHPGWRSACYFNFALLALAFIMFTIFYRPVSPPNPEGLSIMQRILKVDLAGLVLLACAVVPLMMGLIWGGVAHPWKSSLVIALLVVGGCMFLVLAAHQLWIKKDGLFHHDLFKNRNFAICLASISVEGMVYNVFTAFYGQETGILFDARPYFLALRFAAFLLGALIVSPAYAFYSYKRRDPKGVLIMGYVAFLISFICMATITPGTNKAIIFYAFLAGVGFCAPLLYLNVIVQLSVKPEVMGLATALVVSSRSLGGTMGVAICNAVFTSKITSKLPAYIAKAVIKAGLPASSAKQVVTGIAKSNKTMAASAPGVNSTILAAGHTALLHAYSDSLRFVWITAIPIVFVGLLGILILKPSKKEMNAVIDRPVDSFGAHTHG